MSVETAKFLAIVVAAIVAGAIGIISIGAFLTARNYRKAGEE